MTDKYEPCMILDTPLNPNIELIAEVERLRKVVREMRERQFYTEIKRYAHEREWEYEEAREVREEWNRKRKAEWDEETERIATGVK